MRFHIQASPPNEAQRIDYLFLSHAHKDHTGAVPHLIQMGFQGTIVASPETFSQIGLHYNKVQDLDFANKESADFEGFRVIAGSSGHCPGSLWFHVCFDGGYKFFYSGDFQPDPLVYRVDMPKNLDADVAIIDMAYDAVLDSASLLRENLSKKYRNTWSAGNGSYCRSRHSVGVWRCCISCIKLAPAARSGWIRI